MATIGTRIKQLRAAKHITQKEFSNRICVSQSYVSRLESDVEVPTDMLIKLIALDFDVSIEWLSSGTGEMEINDSTRDYYDRNYATEIREGMVQNLVEFSNFLTENNTPAIDGDMGAIIVNFESLITLFKQDIHFGSLIFSELTSIILTFVESIEWIERKESSRENIDSSLWKTIDEIHNHLKNVRELYMQRKK